MRIRFTLLLLVLVSTQTYSQSPTCNVPAIQAAMANAGYQQLTVIGQPCFLYFYNSNLTSNWSTAQQQAQAVGGNLLSITSATENAAVLAAAQSAGLTGGVWIGFTDAASEGNWVWVDGTPATFVNWNPGEPSNSGGFPCYTDEDGAIMQLSNGNWNDLALNNGCPGAAQFASIIKINLCPEIVASGTTGCTGQPVTVNATGTFGSSPYTYAWFLPPSATPVDNDSSLTVTLSAPAVYVAGLQDAYGCTDTALVAINVTNCFTPPGCDIAAIDAAMATGGYIYLNVQNQPCSRYYFNNTPTSNWNTAQQQAQAVGGNLVSINNAAENAALLSAAQAQGFSGGIWIGFSDAAQEGNWVWTNGSANTFTNWNPGEPSNSGGFPCYTDEDGAIMQLSNGQWNDLALNNGCPGAAQFRSVIEIDLCPVVNGNGPTAAVCESTATQLTSSTTLGSPAYTYQWSSLPAGTSVGSTANINVTPTATTAYQVQSTDRYGCLALDTVLVSTQVCNNPSTCNIPAINAAMAAANFQFLNVQNTPCARYYYNPSATSNWNTASNQAAAVGATLLTITSAAENAAVLAAAQAQGLTGGVWIGFTDIAQEGNWVWQDGSPVTYTNWNPGEPNNTTDICSSSGEDAAIMQLSNGRWNDVYVNPGFPCLSPAQYRSIVKVNLCPVVNAGINPAVVCAGQGTQLSATAQFGSVPFTFVWNQQPSGTQVGTTANVTVSPTVTGEYTVLATDRYGCTARDTVGVTVAGAASQTFTISPNPVCTNNPVTVTYTGPSGAGATYTWNFGGATVISGSGQGPYTISFPNAGNNTITLNVTEGSCTSPPASQNITVNAGPVVNAGPDVSICSGDVVTLGSAPVAGVTYVWVPAVNLSDPAIANPQFSGFNTTGSPETFTYILGAQANGCGAIDSVTVTLSPAPSAAITPSPATVCEGSSITLTASGGSAYSWSSGGSSATETVTPVSTTTYSVTVSAGPNCTASASVDVTVNPLPAVSITPNPVSVCGGNPTVITASGGVNYTWGTGETTASVTIAPTTPTTYTVTATDGNGCTGSATANADLFPAFSVTVSPAWAAFCEGGTVTLDAGGGNTYAWSSGESTGSITVSPATSTTYTITATDINGCTASASALVTVYPNPQITNAVVTDETCFGLANGSVGITTGNGTLPYTYNWNTNPVQTSAQATNLPAGSYLVTVSDANTCSVSGNYTVNSPVALLITVDNATDVTCNGQANGAVTVSVSGGNAPYSYTWSNGAGTTSLNGLAAGSYGLTLTDANGCTTTASVTINEPAPLAASITGIDSVALGTQIQLNTNVQPAGGSYTYSWSPASYLSCNNCPSPDFYAVQSTLYTVLVTDDNGCTATAQKQISVITDKVVFIPNVFTPNNDNANDVWFVYTPVPTVYYHVRVFNRWGEKVYDSYNITEGWGGKYKSDNSPNGVYTYVIDFTFIDGDNRTYKGSLTVLR